MYTEPGTGLARNRNGEMEWYLLDNPTPRDALRNGPCPWRFVDSGQPIIPETAFPEQFRSSWKGSSRHHRKD